MNRARPRAILAFAVVGFFALLILALGMTSLLTGQAVISEPGLTQAPGIAGAVGAGAAFAAVTGAALLRHRAGAGSALLSGVAAAAAYGAGIVVGVVASGADLLRALGVAGVVLSWPGAAVFASATIAGALAAVVARARPGTPRWPWERDDEE